MKKFFLMILLLLVSINVNAKSYSFYEAEWIDGIYINRYESSTKITHYQKARFFREKSTDDFAYCVEPEIKFDEDYSYTASELNLSGSTVKRMKEIAHYGYGYKNHTDKAWYAVTQVMLWQETEGKNNVYFTDSLNGNKINKYDSMINEINTLIETNSKIPSFSTKTFYMIENQELVLKDTNNVLNNYTNSLNLPVTNNTINLKGLKEGTYNIKLNRKDNNYNDPVLFYISDGSQNLLKTGNLSYLNTSIKVQVVKTKLTINKIDKDTGNTTNTGKASFKNTKFELINTNTNETKELILSEDNNIIIDNIEFGTYKLKEIQAGEGYNLNTNIFEFTIDNNNLIQELTIENEVIKKKLIIHKTYGTKEKQVNEANIEFNIFDDNNKLIKTIKTDKNGNAEITLPYGKYIIKQLTTTEGYDFIDPIEIRVEDSKEQIINLKDYKIEVPDTYTNNFNILVYILLLLL